MAYAAKYKDTGQVTLCFFGEAAVNQGIFHESLNMAQLWKLPIIYICENNQYGMGTSQDRAMSTRNIARKAEAFEMANEFVDGMDVMAVRDATLRAIERARKGSSPTLLEIRAYRYMGHSMSDPGNYRTREEIAKYQERDPIVLFKDSLKESGVFNDKDFEKIELEVAEAVELSIKFADESPSAARKRTADRCSGLIDNMNLGFSKTLAIIFGTALPLMGIVRNFTTGSRPGRLFC